MTVIRPPLPPKTPTLARRSVLITGGTGAFGQAFTRRALEDGAARVVVYSRSESKQAAMRQAFGPDDCHRVRFLLGDVRDATRVLDACRGVEVVVHAAALKRIESCERDAGEAVATNVYGTQRVARACVERGVARAVFLSTDKAASPNTLYGSTKLVAERLWLGHNVYAASTPTRFAATRYGNVLGSTGSVVPFWRQQFAVGQPLTITDPTCSRFWMTMADAVDLVILALDRMRGGEVFVPKVGAAPLLTLARAIVEGDGTYAPGHVTTGLRPGEKVHETLISSDEARHTWDCGDHYLIEPPERTWGAVAPVTGALVPEGFSYRSDAGARDLTVDDLRRMMAL